MKTRALAVPLEAWLSGWLLAWALQGGGLDYPGVSPGPARLTVTGSDLEAYGYASWTPRKGIVTLRNPDDRPQAFALDARPD